ncbi:MAG: hypothetical protein AB1711_11065 [Thermodesulfobacteriota bacterium]
MPSLGENYGNFIRFEGDQRKYLAERGISVISLASLDDIAKALNVPVTELAERLIVPQSFVSASTSPARSGWI